MIVLGSGVINWGHKEHLGRGGRKSASAKIFVTNEHKCLLLLLPTCLDISYPTAYHFTFKPRAPPQKKNSRGCTSLFLPRVPRTIDTPHVLGEGQVSEGGKCPESRINLLPLEDEQGHRRQRY